MTVVTTVAKVNQLCRRVDLQSGDESGHNNAIYKAMMELTMTRRLLQQDVAI